jgi:hypothetical protein
VKPFQIVLGLLIVLVVGLGVLIAVQFLPQGGSRPLPLAEGGGSIDNEARIEIERLRAQIEGLNEQIGDLRDQMRDLERLATRSPDAAVVPPGTAVIPGDGGPNAIVDRYAQVVLIADRRNVNRGINVASPSFLKDFLGMPRENLSDDCQPMTNPKLRSMLKVESVGPIRVQMLEPAIESLKRVFERVRETDPDLYDRIASSGSLCVRQIRGSVGRVSTHAFGLAVDLNVDGQLDTLGDGRTQLGLTILADFFREEGWVWGAGFSREDSMHFEVSRQQLEEWREAGRI